MEQAREGAGVLARLHMPAAARSATPLRLLKRSTEARSATLGAMRRVGRSAAAQRSVSDCFRPIQSFSDCFSAIHGRRCDSPG